MALALAKGRLGRLSSRIRASKIMNTRFGRGLQSIGNAMKNGLRKVAKVFGSITKRVTPWMGVANSAFQVWYIFKQYKKCKETAKKAKESLANMTKLVANNTENLNEVKESYLLMQLALTHLSLVALLKGLRHGWVSQIQHSKSGTSSSNIRNAKRRLKKLKRV
ncbi:hypothetical protein AC249_AIPGENE17003 [Exaiptasia diaphana]|nr:hypothetical protein AC249_AIPGENE17003 [Exaiptasia diaphana]